jgi:hypothetical protein
MRHPKQNLGLAQKLAPRTTGLNDPRIRGAVSGYTDEATKGRDVEALAAVQASRAKKPPHKHVYVNGTCEVCGVEVIDSTTEKT